MRELLIPELGLHHFAYLRATAEGLPQIDSGKRYLAIEHGSEIVTVNRMVVERARAHVRRLKDPRWRLIGLNLQEHRLQAAETGQPTLAQWAESEGLEDWPENELLSLYAERFPPVDEASGRRQQRNERLRLTRIDLLRKLEETARAAASEAHPLSGWLPPHLAQQLAASGMHTLGDLVTRMRQGGRWYHAISGFGKLKSQALENFVRGVAGSQCTEK